MAGRLGFGPRIWVAQMLVLAVVPLGGAAQTITNEPQLRALISFNAGLAQPFSTSFSNVATELDPTFGAEFKADYGIKNGLALDVGGAVLGSTFGVGFAVSRYTDKQPASAALTFSIPGQPLRTFRSDFEPLGRTEIGAHIQFAFVVPVPGPFSVVVFGGPSHFSVEQKLVAGLEIVLTSFNPRTGEFSVGLSEPEWVRLFCNCRFADFA